MLQMGHSRTEIKVRTYFSLNKGRRTVILGKKDVQPPMRRASVISSKTNTFNYVKWYQETFGATSLENGGEYDISSDESEGLNISSNLKVQSIQTNKNNVLHFIPSAHRKIIKGN